MKILQFKLAIKKKKVYKKINNYHKNNVLYLFI